MGQPVAARGLERVRERVAEVQRGAHAGALLRVTGDHVGLDPRAAGHEIAEHRRITVEHRGRLQPQQLDQPGRVRDHVAEQRVLRDLAEAGAVLGLGQRLQRVGVGEHADRLVERADEVLALGQVHRGLAADRGVDHREQRRRHLQHRDPAVVGRGREPGGVADDSPAERDHRVAAQQPPRREPPAEVLDGAEGLRLLAVTHEEDLDLGVEPGAHRVGVPLRDLRPGSRARPAGTRTAPSPRRRARPARRRRRRAA